MTHNATELTRIKEKVAKLMRLAEKATNEHEAANAMAKARSLMDKYQLDQAECAVEEQQHDFAAKHGSRAYAAVPGYLQSLAVHVAKFNDCIVTFAGAVVDYKKGEGDAKKWGKVFVFSGLRDDVDMAIEMFARLQGAINGLCKNYLDVNGFVGKYPVKIGNAYKEGTVVTIGRLLTAEQSRRAAMVTSTGTSLVVLKMALVEKHFGEAEYGTRKSKALDNDTAHAYFSGKNDANNINVTAMGVGSDANKLEQSA